MVELKELNQCPQAPPTWMPSAPFIKAECLLVPRKEVV